MSQEIDEFRTDVQRGIDCLDSLCERVLLLREPAAEENNQRIGSQDRNPGNRRVFIVHGHDEAARLAVARFLEAIDFEPVILQERANRGDTIIEKFERHAEVGFAVVLMTPDDVGGKDAHNLQPRARQNVIAVLGYFVGRLGRGRVLPLMKGALEIPTDFSGLSTLIWMIAGAGKWNSPKNLMQLASKWISERLLVRNWSAVRPDLIMDRLVASGLTRNQ